MPLFFHFFIYDPFNIAYNINLLGEVPDVSLLTLSALFRMLSLVKWSCSLCSLESRNEWDTSVIAPLCEFHFDQIPWRCYENGEQNVGDFAHQDAVFTADLAVGYKRKFMLKDILKYRSQLIVSILCPIRKKSFLKFFYDRNFHDINL